MTQAFLTSRDRSSSTTLQTPETSGLSAVHAASISRIIIMDTASPARSSPTMTATGNGRMHH